MTVEEIQAELAAMEVALIERGKVRPYAYLQIRGNDRFSVDLHAADMGFGESSYEFIYGDTPAKCIAEAQKFIAALPDAKDLIMRTYLGKLADAVDYGHENHIPAECVDPVRITQKAMSDNLLAAPQVPA